MSENPATEQCFLVLLPTGREAGLVGRWLKKAGLRSVRCADLAELCQRYQEESAAALLIAEEAFGRDGFQLLKTTLFAQESWSDLPVLIVTGQADTANPSPLTARQLLSIGNVTLLERPLRPVTMLSAARAGLRARQRQYEARRELYEHRRAVHERDQYLAMLGHELRNPLSAITLAMKLDHETGEQSGRQVIQRQLEHLTHLVEDLLDASRVTSGNIKLRREYVELSALIERCLQAFPEKALVGRTLRHTPDAQPIWVYADPVRMEQVLGNLIANAIKYTADHGTIEIAATQVEERAVIRVCDDGVGIEPDMLARIFDLFTQANITLDRAKGGLGVGLTLVRSLVGMHGGAVAAHSAGLGHGSEFTVQLPCATPSEDKSGERSSGVEPIASQTPPMQLSDVLIIEDNEDSRELLATILRARGHHVFTAEDGQSGVAQALEHRPRLMLVDIGLPVIDGYEVARQVRDALGEGTYLVAITGYGQPEDKSRALAAGFDLHLVKPLDTSTLDGLLVDSRKTTQVV